MSRRIKPNRAVATYPIPVVGILMGVGRNAAYDAAHDEIFKTICVRGRIVAVAGSVNRILELTGPDDPRVIEAYRLAGFGAERSEASAPSRRLRAREAQRHAAAEAAATSP
jgi:hypothetical protein